MLPKTAEYALRATVWLAQEPGRAYACEQIAKATRGPRRYVHRVLQALVRAAIVRSRPGPHGGYSLDRPAERTTILDVVNAVGSVERIRTCPLGLASHTDLCPLHRELDEAYAAMERAFARVTIADLVRGPKRTAPLCEAAPPRTSSKAKSKR